jgi:hypothetical protein
MGNDFWFRVAVLGAGALSVGFTIALLFWK